MYNKSEDKHTMLTTFKGEDRNPVLSKDGNSVYYLSEQSGTLNIHRFELDNPSQNVQLTTLKTHPVRFLSYGNDTTWKNLYYTTPY